MDATALFLCGPLEKTATSFSNNTSFANILISVLPVRYCLTGVFPERSFQNTELEVVNTNIDSKSGEDENAFFQFFLIFFSPTLQAVERSTSAIPRVFPPRSHGGPAGATLIPFGRKRSLPGRCN